METSQRDSSLRESSHSGLEGGSAVASRTEKTGAFRARFNSALGKVILGICVAEKHECNNRHCVFQPVCACARAELQKAGKSESRIWLAVAICGVVLILIAFVRVFLPV